MFKKSIASQIKEGLKEGIKESIKKEAPTAVAYGKQIKALINKKN
ncbi:hypothetical protein [Peribacillus acanthi]|nr:hypothetical protein [Peribacillus acanthi]